MRPHGSARTRARHVLAPALLISALLACDGGGAGPSPPPPGGGAPSDPCAAAALEAELAEHGSPLVADPAVAERKRGPFPDHDPRWRVLDALWTHRARELQLGPAWIAPAPVSPSPAAAAIGDIAIVHDEGDISLPPNPFDLRGAGLRFTPNADGGYDVRRIDGAFRTTLGTRLLLDDDDSRQVNVPFEFRYYDRTQTQAFVNSDGNITFEEGDRASTERNVARLLTGPPRVAPFFADLDPTTGAGRMFVHAASDQYTVTWCNVRGFDSPRIANVQATLLPDGTVEMKYGAVLTLPDAIVALSPGRTGDFRPVDLSEQGPTPGGGGAVGERFAEAQQVDTVSLLRKFYRDHPDDYDQLVIFADSRVVTDAFAYEITVANEIRGIGVDVYDVSRQFGSAGRLRSFAMMDWIGKYPDNPGQRFLGENSTLSLLGHEVGHRWLAFFRFRDHAGRVSDALLGRDLAHWSFFFDSDASVMEGNDIEDLGGGAFRTTTAVERYSLLDQYAMGLVPPSAVPPFFYVEGPVNVSPSATRESAPRVGVTFNGTRRDVLIQDIVAVHGARVPASAEAPRVHRQAFVFLVGVGRSPDAAHVARIDRIRREWEPHFRRLTEGRMTAITTLR